MNSKILLTAMAFAMIGGGFGVPSYRHVNKNSKIDDIMEQLVKHGSAIIDNSDFGYLYKILPYNMIKRFACATSILKNEEEKGWIAIPEYSRCKFCPINHICPSAIKQEKC